MARDGRWIHDKTITGQIQIHKGAWGDGGNSLELYNFVMAQTKLGGQRSTDA